MSSQNHREVSVEKNPSIETTYSKSADTSLFHWYQTSEPSKNCVGKIHRLYSALAGESISVIRSVSSMNEISTVAGINKKLRNGAVNSVCHWTTHTTSLSGWGRTDFTFYVNLNATYYSMYKANIHLTCRFCYILAAFIERASALFPCSRVLAMAFLRSLMHPNRLNWDPACWSKDHGP